MATKKKDLSEVTNEEALAYLDALFCQGYAAGRRFRYFYPYSMFITFLEDTGKESPTLQDRALTAASRWNTGVDVVDTAASIINRMDLSSTVSA